jgi:surface antigen
MSDNLTYNQIEHIDGHTIEYNNDEFKNAVLNGNLEEIVRLLGIGVDPSDQNNFAVRRAAENGHVAVVDQLLRDPRVDSSFYDNEAVLYAARNGHLAIVEQLLQDKRVDPSARNNLAVRLAAKNGHLAVVERLLQDARVDPTADDNCAVRWAAENDRLAVVNQLFQDPRVYSTINLEADQIKHIGMIRSRSTEVCNALQDLGLPALLTVGILDELFPNEIRMWAKWELVTAVKHFHQRRQAKKQLLLKK